MSEVQVLSSGRGQEVGFERRDRPIQRRVSVRILGLETQIF